MFLFCFFWYFVLDFFYVLFDIRQRPPFMAAPIRTNLCFFIQVFFRVDLKFLWLCFVFFYFCFFVFNLFYVFIWYKTAAPHSWRRQLGELISNFSAPPLVGSMGSANFAGFRNSSRWVVHCHSVANLWIKSKRRKGWQFLTFKNQFRRSMRTWVRGVISCNDW